VLQRALPVYTSQIGISLIIATAWGRFMSPKILLEFLLLILDNGQIKEISHCKWHRPQSKWHRPQSKWHRPQSKSYMTIKFSIRVLFGGRYFNIANGSLCKADKDWIYQYCNTMSMYTEAAYDKPY